MKVRDCVVRFKIIKKRNILSKEVKNTQADLRSKSDMVAWPSSITHHQPRNLFSICPHYRDSVSLQRHMKRDNVTKAEVRRLAWATQKWEQVWLLLTMRVLHQVQGQWVGEGREHFSILFSTPESWRKCTEKANTMMLFKKNLCLEIANIFPIHGIRRPKYNILWLRGSEVVPGLHTYSVMSLEMLRVPKPWGKISL